MPRAGMRRCSTKSTSCRAEAARLETAERLAEFLALIAVVSWRIFFFSSERARLDAPRRRRREHCPRPDSRLSHAAASPTETSPLTCSKIAVLGGYFARKHDPPPGNMVVWRGLTRLHDIAFSISIDQAQDVANRKAHRTVTRGCGLSRSRPCLGRSQAVRPAPGTFIQSRSWPVHVQRENAQLLCSEEIVCAKLPI